MGSSTNLTRRFMNYYNSKQLLIRASNMQICRALLKHGYSNFSLTII
uniref:Ribosomal protein S3 n=1 Tax=Orbilia brochopaga TaxID=3140254 RepID=A0A481ZL74_9PEZI|nr:ribosomal protein S3 [Drechslerella brochopaga]QBL02501.1 ribosomal protein S3 [Drechslerella brochopaga]